MDENDEWLDENYPGWSKNKYPMLVEDERDPFWRPGK